MEPKTKKRIIFFSLWVGVIACSTCLGLLISKVIAFVTALANFNPFFNPTHFIERVFVIILMILFNAALACALIGAIAALATSAIDYYNNNKDIFHKEK